MRPEKREIKILETSSENKKEILYKLINPFGLIGICFAIICLCGCIWQIVSICQVFFAFPTTVVISFQRPKKVEIPAVTICGVHNITIRRSKILTQNPWKS